jgi:hypothetical protein
MFSRCRANQAPSASSYRCELFSRCGAWWIGVVLLCAGLAFVHNKLRMLARLRWLAG